MKIFWLNFNFKQRFFLNYLNWKLHKISLWLHGQKNKILLVVNLFNFRPLTTLLLYLLRCDMFRTRPKFWSEIKPKINKEPIGVISPIVQINKHISQSRGESYFTLEKRQPQINTNIFIPIERKSKRAIKKAVAAPPRVEPRVHAPNSCGARHLHKICIFDRQRSWSARLLD